MDVISDGYVVVCWRWDVAGSSILYCVLGYIVVDIVVMVCDTMFDCFVYNELL